MGRAATRFAAAVVENDPGAAPKGSPEYIKGMRAYFGDVTGARVIGTHNERADANTNTSRTYPVADVLLRSERGSAVIELAFDTAASAARRSPAFTSSLPMMPPRCRRAIASSSLRRLPSAAASPRTGTRSSMEPPGVLATRRCAAARSGTAGPAGAAGPSEADPRAARGAARAAVRPARPR